MQMDGHTNSIQNESPHYPYWYGQKNFYTPFFYLSKNRVSSLTSRIWFTQLKVQVFKIYLRRIQGYVPICPGPTGVLSYSCTNTIKLFGRIWTKFWRTICCNVNFYWSQLILLSKHIKRLKSACKLRLVLTRCNLLNCPQLATAFPKISANFYISCGPGPCHKPINALK